VIFALFFKRRIKFSRRENPIFKNGIKKILEFLELDKEQEDEYKLRIQYKIFFFLSRNAPIFYLSCDQNQGNWITGGLNEWAKLKP